jgi:hypothetical protein
MTKLILPKETIRPNGVFFSQMLEATARGCTLLWNSDYTFAELFLDTTVFLTKEDIVNIINAGGDIEGLPVTVDIDKETYDTGLVDTKIVNYVDSNITDATWKMMFQTAYLDEEANIYKMVLVPTSVLEPIKMSVVLSVFGIEKVQYC